jgi:transglutaminase-like putative cysteine protease
LLLDTQFTSVGSNKLTTTKTYSAKVRTSKDVPLPSYTQPTNITLTQTEKENIYDIQAVDRIGKTSWIQFGTSQYYKFKLVQEALKTDNITPEQISNIAPIVSTNVYKIALPREYDENSQNILINSITPKPKSIERDIEGNLIAIFDTPANKDSQIVIEGLIEISKQQFDKAEKIKDINLADYKSQIGNLGAYTQPEQYIESNDQVVKNVADKLYSKSSSIMELVRNNYNYVVNEFDYSYSKLSQSNLRLGAKAALSGSQTICMEYADALTAIFRAQGIPARTAIGYGNDPHNSENIISNTKLNEQLIGHQWVQVWIPQYGWLSVDPTWGESNRTYIGSDLDHILWYTQSPSSQDITDVIFYSAERSNLGKYQIFLQALDQNTFETESKNAQSLTELNITEKSTELPIDFYLKTSFAGRVIIYLLPLFATISISIVITTIIYFVKSRIKKNS